MIHKLINEINSVTQVIEERIMVYEASFELTADKMPNFEIFSEFINLVPKRDLININITNSIDDILTITKEKCFKSKYEEFMQELIKDDEIKIKITIDKNVENNLISIYDFDKFSSFILQHATENVLSIFSNFFKRTEDCIVFDMYDNNTLFYTKSMFFIPHENITSKISQEFNRKTRIEKCKNTTYFYNFDKYELLPDDFMLTVNYDNNPFTSLFNKLTTLLSMCFITSSSHLENNRVNGFISGSRTQNFSFNIEDISFNKYLYDIYSWIYTDGNSVDKSIIARNIISMQCKYCQLTDLDEKIMVSIESNYSLYLKDNVKEYLDLKNKISEFISNVILKTGEYSNNLLNKYIANLVAIFGFLFTVVLSNITTNQPIDNIFTKDFSLLMYFVLIGSIVYSIVCYHQSCYEINEAYNSFEQLKSNYSDILSESELSELFKNKSKIEDTKKQITTRRNIYFAIWVIILFLCILIIDFCYNSDPIHPHIFDFIENVISTIKNIFTKKS